MKDFWDERYAREEYVYGELPNNYLTTRLPQISAGKILFVAEGEGRNAVYAARQGWEVSAFDQSRVGKIKADRLAQKHEVKIDYRVGELPQLNFQKEEFDALGLIYAHFSPEIRSEYHQLLLFYLKKDGFVFFEGFSKKHTAYQKANPDVGGPKDPDLLYSMEEIKKDFGQLEFLELLETEVDLKEGIFHNGLGAVIRFVGRKK